jgi:hypothetical protein
MCLRMLPTWITSSSPAWASWPGRRRRPRARGLRGQVAPLGDRGYANSGGFFPNELRGGGRAGHSSASLGGQALLRLPDRKAPGNRRRFESLLAAVTLRRSSHTSSAALAPMLLLLVGVRFFYGTLTLR